MAARVSYVERDELDAEGQAIYDQIRADRNAAKVGFQFRALLNSPRATGHLASLGTQIRFHSAIPEALKEVAILVIAREFSSDIEWTAHAPIAAKAGLSADVIETIRSRKALEGLTGDHLTIARFVLSLVRDRTMPDDLFAAAHDLLGARAAVDLTLTCSYYCALCLAQIALRPEMEPGKASLL